MMYRYLPAAVITTLSLVISTVVLAQCCTVPNGDPYFDNMIIWDGIDIEDEEVVYNGTLFIDGHMRIINSTITMEGKGLVLNSTGSLEVINSKITSGSKDHAFYLDLFGPSSFANATLEGCLDMDNGYFGIYVEGDRLIGKDLIMTRSGMIRIDGGDLELDGSTISGIMSYSGNATLRDSLVDLTGITQLGPGTIDLSNVTVTSNISYSQTAGISSMSGGTLHLQDTTITGSFNAGISAVSSTVWINGTTIDLDRQIFGIRGTDTAFMRSSGIAVMGTEIGIELYNCTLGSPISDANLNTSYFGMSFQGNNPVEIESSIVMNASYGVTSSAPLTMTQIHLMDNQVGLLLEDNSMIEMSNCTFERYGQWAIEDETWDPRFFPENTFIPSEDSLGTYAWWGWITVEIYGPNGIEVSGAEVIINSSLGSSAQVLSPDIGVIWSYGNATGETILVTYDLSAKWGTATARREFVPSEGESVEIILPLTDIILKDILVEDGSAFVTIECNGSEAKEVDVELYVDGKFQESAHEAIGEGEERTVMIDLKGIEPGKHEFRALITSNDEYSGIDGYLQENNGKTVEINVKGDEDEGLISILLLGLIFASVMILVGIIMLPRRD